jgi:hypothetical protein
LEYGSRICRCARIGSFPDRMRSRISTLCVLAALVIWAAGCNSILGANDYKLKHDAVGAAGAGGASGGGGTGGTSGTGGASGTGGQECQQALCWACAPTTYAQFLNACTDSICVPFDDSMSHLPLLLAGGELPPLPEGTGGTGGGGAGGSSGSGGGGTGGQSGSGGNGGNGGSDPCHATGCFSCVPKSYSEFLNACTTAKCVAFDDATRLPLLEMDGSLPKLP